MKKIKIILGLFMLMFATSYSDNFIFNKEKIKESFIEYKLLSLTDPTVADFVRYSPFGTISISVYENETKKEAMDRIDKREKGRGKKYIGRNSISKKYFGVDSYEYYSTDIYTKRYTHCIYLDEVKIYIQYNVTKKNDEKNYIEFLKNAEEALNPSKKIGKRGTKKLYFKEKEFSEIFDIEILDREFNKREYPKLRRAGLKNPTFKVHYELTPAVVEKKKNKITKYDWSYITIRRNNTNTKEYSEQEEENLRRDKARSGEGDLKYVGENEMSVKYFGVPSKMYQFSVKDAMPTKDRVIVEMKGMMKSDYIYHIDLIITEDYTIKIIKMLEVTDKGMKKYNKEYETYLKKIKKAFKLKV